MDDNFTIDTKDHQPVQYASTYSTRLALMSPMLLEKVQRMGWIESNKDIVNVIKLKKGVMSTILGLVYKEMKLKPSAFDENEKFQDVKKGFLTESGFREVMVGEMVSDNDQLYVEDKSGRVEIDFSTINPVTTLQFENYGSQGLKPEGYQLRRNDFVTG